MITTQIGLQDADHCAGIHLNMVIAIPGGDDELTEEERQAMADAMAVMTDGAGYQQIQGTRPQTLGYGLNDSPAGLCGWIAEKFHAWTDNDGTIESAVSRDDLLTNITTYWVTGTINSLDPPLLRGHEVRPVRPAGGRGRGPDGRRGVPRRRSCGPPAASPSASTTSSTGPTSTAAATSPPSRSPTSWSTTSAASTAPCPGSWLRGPLSVT